MWMTKRFVGLVLAGSVVTTLGWSIAAAEEPAQPADESLVLEQTAVDPVVLEEQSGTAPVGAAPDLAVPGTVDGASSLDQPSFASSGTTMSGGLVSSSSLQATTAGGAVSVGQ